MTMGVPSGLGFVKVDKVFLPRKTPVDGYSLVCFVRVVDVFGI